MVAALAHGGRLDGEPRPRQAEVTAYYGAFILVPDGNNIEAVTFPAGWLRTEGVTGDLFVFREGNSRAPRSTVRKPVYIKGSS